MLCQDLRPQNLEEIVGNEAVVKALKAYLSSDVRAHTLLFQGPSGCGKTTLARILARELGCKGTDLIEYNAANMRGIDTARDIASKVAIGPGWGDSTVWILDESHQLTSAAQEALLKVIEDCPSHCYFFLCTTRPEKIVKTIRTRCTVYQVETLRPADVRKLLNQVLSLLDIEVDEEVLKAIVKSSQGTPRTAVTQLEQILFLEPKEAFAVLAAGPEAERDVLELCREVAGTAKWNVVKGVYSKLKDPDPENVRRAVLGYLKSCLLNTENPTEAKLFAELISILSPACYDGGEAQLLSQLFRCCAGGG